MGRMYAKVFEDAARRRTDMKRLTDEELEKIRREQK